MYLKKSGMTKSTINGYVFALKYMHLQQGAEFPKVPELTSVIEGLQKELPSAQNAKKAVSITLFKEGCAFLYAKRQDEPLEVRWIQWKVIWIFGFLGYLRSDDAFRLNVKDVEILETGVKLTFRSSKTDPKGEGQAIFLGESEHPWYSPVSAARDWLHSLQAKPNEFGPDTPWMRKVNAIKGISYVEEGRLPKAAYTTIVRLLITKIAPSEREVQYTAHSLRSGGASYGFKVGVPESRIKIQGRWKSETFRRYIHVHQEELMELTRALNL